MRTPRRAFCRARLAFGAAAALGAMGILGGCAGRSEVVLRSVDQPLAVAPDLPLAAYSARDRNTADIYLTDLRPADLDAATDLGSLEGQIVHIHMFLAPRAGRTPIEDTACSVTVRHAILARGVVGLYGGGGFMHPSGTPGDDRFGGTIRDATLRLLGSTAGFMDRLGASVLEADVSAPLDEPLARLIGARLDDVALLVGRAGAATPPGAADEPPPDG